MLRRGDEPQLLEEALMCRPEGRPHAVVAAVAARDGVLERLAHFVPHVRRRVVHLHLRSGQLHLDRLKLREKDCITTVRLH